MQVKRQIVVAFILTTLGCLAGRGGACPGPRAESARLSTRYARESRDPGATRQAARQYGASRFLRWVPGLVPLAQARSLYSPGTRDTVPRFRPVREIDTVAARVIAGETVENEISRRA